MEEHSAVLRFRLPSDQTGPKETGTVGLSRKRSVRRCRRFEAHRRDVQESAPFRLVVQTTLKRALRVLLGEEQVDRLRVAGFDERVQAHPWEPRTTEQSVKTRYELAQGLGRQLREARPRSACSAETPRPTQQGLCRVSQERNVRASAANDSQRPVMAACRLPECPKWRLDPNSCRMKYLNAARTSSGLGERGPAPAARGLGSLHSRATRDHLRPNV